MKKRNMLSQMTIEEKAKLVCGGSFFGTNKIDRLNIPEIQFLDGGTGLNFEQLFGHIMEKCHREFVEEYGEYSRSVLTRVIDNFYDTEKLTEQIEISLREFLAEKLEDILDGEEFAPGCYPPGILLGATWNPDIVRRTGEALGREASLYKIDVLLGTPNVNILRAPLNGRFFEGYSEDPYHVSKLAPELVIGVQSKGVIANVKHFAANNQETNRVGINEIISERALQEIYYPGFKACVTKGKVKSVMSAYNRINGVACTANKKLLTDTLRNEWRFDGMVVSDWGAAYDQVSSLKAGNDLAMPGPIDSRKIEEAVWCGDLAEKELDINAGRIIDVTDIIQNNRQMRASQGIELDELDETTAQIAYEAACEGIVVLENDNMLPLRYRRIALAGTGAGRLIECGSGSAGIKTTKVGNLSKELSEYASIVDIKEAEAVVYVASLGGAEGNDRKNLNLLPEDITGLSNIRKPVILVLNVCGPVDLSWIDRRYVKAIICAFLPGMGGAKALADIIAGEVNPSGRLPFTWPARIEDTPSYINFPGDGMETVYGEGIYVGYRYYDKKKIKPLYPFGYGLSYTNFDYSNAIDISVTDEYVSFNIGATNIGYKYGKDVMQVYVSDPYSTVSKPVKELKYFEKIELNPAQTKYIRVTIPIEEFGSYDTDYHKSVVEEGYYDIIVARSAAEEDIKTGFRIYIDRKSEYTYGLKSSVKTVYEHNELTSIVKEFWKRNRLDWDIVETNYMYTSHVTLESIIPEQILDKAGELEEKMAKVIKE